MNNLIKNRLLQVKGNSIRLSKIGNEDYLSITDIAKYKGEVETDDVIKNWLRNRSTIEFLGLWEKLNNQNFKPVEFDGFRVESGSNRFVMSPTKWVKNTNAIGLTTRSGKNGGTFAHKDIAFEFASWISMEFKLYLITEFQRLKNDENQTKNIEWNVHRILSKINYRIHTDAINMNLIPSKLSQATVNRIYSNEADILNIALFGETAKDWRGKNHDKKGNIRDYATIEQLIVLVNLENLNAEFIKRGLKQSERLIRLNDIAISQMKLLLESPIIKKLK